MEVDGGEGPLELRSLCLSHNPLGEAGVHKLAEGLHGNRSLRRLALQYVNHNPTEGEGRLERTPAPRLNPRTRRLRRGALLLHSRLLRARCRDSLPAHAAADGQRRGRARHDA